VKEPGRSLSGAWAAPDRKGPKEIYQIRSVRRVGSLSAGEGTGDVTRSSVTGVGSLSVGEGTRQKHHLQSKTAVLFLPGFYFFGSDRKNSQSGYIASERKFFRQMVKNGPNDRMKVLRGVIASEAL